MVPVVDDLLKMPHLRLELWAGADGGDRQVTWAQTSDLGSPWEFMAGGELLMKNGRTMPRDATAQRQLIEALFDHGISGLVLGMDPDTPVIAPAALERANELRFPVLIAPYSVGFGAIGRAVADENASDEARRLALTGRVYSVIRRSITQRNAVDALHPLARDLACEIAVLDAQTGAPALDNGQPVPDALRLALAGEVQQRGGAIPGVIHLEVDGLRGQIVEVPDEEPTVLMTYAFRAAPPDIVLLQHIATAAAVLLAQQGIRREHERRIGGELLAALMDRRLGQDEAHEQLAERGLIPADCVLVASHGGDKNDERLVHLSLHRRSIPNLLLRRSGLLYALLPSTRDAIQVFHRRLGSRARVGVSNVLHTTGRTPDAVREANWAVRDAAHAPGNLSRYANATLLSILRDTEEARVVVDRTLGPLLTYDAEHGTDLVASLDTYLGCKRSWQESASRLAVHRQTVIYRMRRVEEITGRDLSVTSHIADLWLALRARDLMSPPG